MESLPDEIIQRILSDPILNFVDVLHFSSVSFKFRELVNSNRSLWKTKYFQRWPKIDFEVTCEDWYNECINRVNFEKQAQQLLSDMSPKFIHVDFKKINNFELDFIFTLTNSHPYGYYYLRDFLVAINSLPVTRFLTDKYYGSLLMKHIHKRHYTEVWVKLMMLNVKEQTLEKGAIFVTVWCQEYERGLWNRIETELDDIASKVKSYLFLNFQNHPLKRIPEETQSRWRKENIPGNLFPPEDCKTIIEAIHHVLFEELKYCISFSFSDLCKNKSDIDFALQDRKANPFIFSVIYESIARRLGVKFEILKLPDDYLLRWKVNYRVKNSRCYYIKRSMNGVFITPSFPKKFSSDDTDDSDDMSQFTPCNMAEIAEIASSHCISELVERYISHRDTLELQLLIKPTNLNCYQQLSHSYMVHELNAEELINKLRNVSSQISPVDWRKNSSILHSLILHQNVWKKNHKTQNRRQEDLVVQNRVDGVNFAVGMIVRDKYREVVGVIHGWSVSLKTTLNTQSVYYKALVENGRYDCMLQENLQILHCPPFFSHPSIGRFFDEFCMTYYKPNKELRAQYPQDVDALLKILKKDRENWC